MSDQIIIIGGGPAGIEAAREAALLGLKVTLVSDGLVGGRAGWHSLLPSKVWLDAAGRVQHMPQDRNGNPDQDIASLIVERVNQVKRSWNEQSQRELDALGVQTVAGVASFSGPYNVSVKNSDGDEVATFNGIPVIGALGSVPFFPPALKPDGKRVLAPRFLSHLNELPRSILVIGAGPTGSESAYLFNGLGVSVTWIVDQFGVLPQFDPDAGEALGRALVDQGVSMVKGFMVDRLEREADQVTAVLADGSRHEAEMAFVAIGRRPDWARLNLEQAGIEPGANGEPIVDEFGRTENPLLYLVGDADGGAMIANKATAQARIAVRHACGAPVAHFNMAMITQVTYTEPQVAQIGDLNHHPSITRVRVPFAESLKAHILPDGEGYLDLVYELESGAIRGAVAVGPHAADVLSPVAVALKLGGRIDELAPIYGAYPSLSELPFIAAREADRRK